MGEQKKVDEWVKQESSSFWEPEKPGDELIGKVASIGAGTYGPQHVIMRENGEKVIPSSYKVLQDRMQSVKVGDTVKIVYQGEEAPKVKGHKPTKLFDVYVKKG